MSIPAVTPVRRLTTPFARPQAIASDGRHLWIGSLETQQLYQLEPEDFSVLATYDAPGNPFGMVCMGNEIRVLCGVTDEDHRLIYRFKDQAFLEAPLPCPDDTGSHLGYDGRSLYVSQWYRRRLVRLDEQGRPGSRHAAPHGIAGQVIVGPYAYLLGTDDEAVTPYWITRLDLATGETQDLGTLPYLARGLAFDGNLFWTNLREQGETIAFALP